MGDVDEDELEESKAQEGVIVFDDETAAHLLFWDNTYADWDEESQAWDYVWSADYGGYYAIYGNQATTTAGVATMGGGSVTIVAGGDVYGQIGTFKDGDLSITSQGNISGYFQVADGIGTITTMGSITSPASSDAEYATSLGLLYGAEVTVTALCNIDMGTVFNPTFTTNVNEYDYDIDDIPQYLSYDETTSVSLMAIAGDISLPVISGLGRFLEIQMLTSILGFFLPQ